MEIASFVHTLEDNNKVFARSQKNETTELGLDLLPMSYMTEEEIFDIFFK